MKSNRIQIGYDDRYITIQNTEDQNYKGISYSTAKNADSFRHYETLSKTELLRIQYILLNAYVFACDVLDESIENSESKETLDKYKNLVLVIRKHLRYMTTYIDAYEELVNEYKNV